MNQDKMISGIIVVVAIAIFGFLAMKNWNGDNETTGNTNSKQVQPTTKTQKMTWDMRVRKFFYELTSMINKRPVNFGEGATVGSAFAIIFHPFINIGTGSLTAFLADMPLKKIKEYRNSETDNARLYGAFAANTVITLYKLKSIKKIKKHFSSAVSLFKPSSEKIYRLRFWRNWSKK